LLLTAATDVPFNFRMSMLPFSAAICYAGMKLSAPVPLN